LWRTGWWCHGQVVRRAALGLATAFARYIDNQRKPLRQRELCDWHANKLKASTPTVRDSREK
jgi:hypothetical protein